jgi:hypothetical protein
VASPPGFSPSALFFHGFSTDRCFVIASKYGSHLVVKKPDNKEPKRGELLLPPGGEIEKQ